MAFLLDIGVGGEAISMETIYPIGVGDDIYRGWRRYLSALVVT